MAKPNPKHHKAILESGQRYCLIHSDGKGGNGWLIAQDLGDDYVRVVSVSKEGIGSQYFLAWTGALKVEQAIDENKERVNRRIPEKSLEPLRKIQDLLTTGKAVIRDTRLVAA